MLTFDAARSFHARVDLPPPDEVRTRSRARRRPAGPAPAARVGRVVFVSYSDDALLSAARWRAALRPAFGAAGIGVIDVLRAHGGAGGGSRPARATRAAPTPYDDDEPPVRGPGGLRGAGDPRQPRGLRDTVARRARARWPGWRALQADAAAAGPTDVGWVRRPGGPCAATGEPPDDAEAARALRAVVRVDVRDAALYAVTRESAVGHLQVWADLLRRAPDAPGARRGCRRRPSVPGRPGTVRSPGARSTGASRSTPTTVWAAAWPSA